jgi:hypothetical protein
MAADRQSIQFEMALDQQEVGMVVLDNQDIQQLGHSNLTPVAVC